MWYRLASVEYGFFLADRHGDAVRSGVVDAVLAPLEIPLTPGGDDGDIGLEGVGGQFEAHLIVAFTGGAMGDGVGALLFGDVDHGPGDQRPGERGAEQVVALVDRSRAQHRKDVVTDERFAEIDRVGLAGAGGERLLSRLFDLFSLADVGGESDDLCPVARLEPVQDYRGVEPTRIGQYHLVDLGSSPCGHGSSNMKRSGRCASLAPLPIGAAGGRLIGVGYGWKSGSQWS